VAEHPLRIEAAGLVLEPLEGLGVGSLRYFDASAAVPRELTAALGGALPDALRAVLRAKGVVAAWRAPSETLIVADTDTALGAIGQAAQSAGEWGCWVDQTGGLRVWRLTGERMGELLARVGSTASMPKLGEARVYEPHLLGWLRETAADL
jgi:sarcosine oxidase gamma subunit